MSAVFPPSCLSSRPCFLPPHRASAQQNPPWVVVSALSKGRLPQAGHLIPTGPDKTHGLSEAGPQEGGVRQERKSRQAQHPALLSSHPALPPLSLVPLGQVHGPDESPCVTHTQHTQVSSARAIKYIIRSSSIFSSLDHLEGPGRHTLLFRGHCSRARGPSCSLVPLHSECSLSPRSSVWSRDSGTKCTLRLLATSP